MTPDQINDLIQQLLKTGEILATHAFALSLRQIYLKAILDSITAVLFLVATFIMTKFAVAAHKRYLGRDGDDDDDAQRWIWGAAAGFAAGVFLVNVYLVISYLFNPEWYAVSLLIDTFLK